MNTPTISCSSKGKMWRMPSVFGHTRTEVSDTPDVSGSSKGEVWGTYNALDSRGTESWHTCNVSGSRRREVSERQCEDTDPRKTTAEGSRQTPQTDTSQQPSAYGDQTSNVKEMFEMIKEMDDKKMKEMFEMMKEMENKTMKEMFEMMKEMENKNTKEIFEMMKKMDDKITTLSDTVHALHHLLGSHNRALPEKVTQIQHEEKEENEMLKEKNRKLEERIQELLPKAMAMHQHSEDINDPSHLSAVLKKYEILRLQEWEKVRSSYHWTYEEGSHIIRKLFDACEKDIQQRRDHILNVLDIQPSHNASTKVMMQDIMKLFRQRYHQNSVVYNKIVQEAAIHRGTENETQFLLQCCQIYCLLLLQDPPVKAEWQMNRRYLEHVDKKDVMYWKKPSLLWPIMRRGEEILVKGVVWDQGKMS